MSKKTGRFSITDEFKEQCLEGVKVILETVTVLKQEHCSDKGITEYLATCEHFEEHQEGEVPPLYIALFQQRGAQFVFKRADKIPQLSILEGW